jgi:hypothetical protein|nr:MAG TPA: hypothetical protein [Caudoviricetes sp.]
MIDYELIKIKIDGVDLPAPTKFKPEFGDLDSDSSLRDVKKGIMHRMRIRAGVFKISLTYSIDDLEVVSKVMNMLEPPEFMVETLDIKTLRRKTYKMYCSKSKFEYIAVGDGIFSQGYTFDLTEC